MNVGLCVFGNPVGQVSHSNGLFNEAKLGEIMYLEGLTDGLILSEKESIGIIRQVTDASGKSVGITIGSVIHFAKSFGQDRLGGFVGSAVCFKGMPHPALINTLLFSLTNASLKLIDGSTKKFLHSSEKEWNINLPEPNDNWVQNIQGINQINQKEKSRLIVEIDGGLNIYLLSVIQGILSNPEYNKYETIIVTEKNDFLDRAKNKGYKVITIFDLLNYQNLLSSANKVLNETKIKTVEIIEGVKTQIEVEKSTLANYKNEVEKTKLNLESNINKISQQNQQLHSINQSINQFEKEVQRLNSEKIELQKGNNNQINRIITESSFFKNEINTIANKEIEKRVNDFKKEQKTIDSKYEKIEKGSLQAIYAKPPVFFGFASLVFLLGVLFTYLLFGKENNEVEKETVKPVISTKKEPTIGNTSSNFNVKVPSNDDLKVMFSKNEAISLFIKNSTTNSPNSDSVSDEYLKNSYFLIPIEKSNTIIELDTINFGTTKRYEILKKYLENPANIYINTIGYPDTTGDNKKRLLNHFNWMVEFYSIYEDPKMKDLFQTDSSKHVVPLIKI
jgi:hypothetical protein